MEVSKVDLARCETIIKALKRGKYELEGEEVLAFAQCFAWLGALHERIKTTLDTASATPVVETKKKVKK